MPELLPEETSLSTICTKRPVVQAKVLHRFNISYTAVSHLAFCPPFGRPASCVFPMVHRSGTSRSATLHRRPAQKQLRNGGPASCVLPMVLRSATSAISLFPMVLRNSGLASCVFLMVLLPAAPPRRPAQQQTSFGGEEYSGLASNLAHLGRIC